MQRREVFKFLAALPLGAVFTLPSKPLVSEPVKREDRMTVVLPKGVPVGHTVTITKISPDQVLVMQ